MKKLTKIEWVAVALAVVFVSYMFFGGNIMNMLKNNQSDNNQKGASLTGNSNGVITNDIIVGNGPEAKQGQVLTVHYVLSLQDGTVIQNSKDFGSPFKFILGANQVIPGWEIGFSGMKVGGVRTLIVPPDLAYGSAQAGPIPPNSTLIFTVELLGAEDLPAEVIQQ